MRAVSALLDLALERVERLPGVAALLGRQAAELLGQLGDPALLAECRDADLVERPEVRSGLELGQELVPQAGGVDGDRLPCP